MFNSRYIPSKNFKIEDSLVTTQVVTLIGCGPRGITLLERLLAVVKISEVKDDLIINIINSGGLGYGVHETNQPTSLLVNTVASQITMFTDESVADAGPISIGPCFFTWAQDAGYKYDELNREYTKKSGRELNPNDYLPRAIFGEYLHWVAEKILQELYQYCSVRIVDASVLEVNKIQENKFQINLDNGDQLYSDYVLLATGHSQNELNKREKYLYEKINTFKSANPKLSFIANPYPISYTTKIVDSGVTVAIEGFGLTAVDILSELTTGRSGKFVNKGNGRYLYVKSGLEPKVVLYSKTGMPFCGRATNQKGVSGQYKPTFFTYEFIRKIKEEHGINATKQLDFENHLLPILIVEMQYCYYLTLLKNKKANEEQVLHFSSLWQQAFLTSQSLNTLIDSYFYNDKKFDWEAIMNPDLGRFFDRKSYKAWLIEYLDHDLTQAIEGNIDNPFKAACDVLRDVRDVIRFAIDFSGLTESSHQTFLRKYVPVMNRIAVGPPKERIAELLALIEAEVVDVSFGKGPTISFDETQAKFTLRSGSNISDVHTREIDQLFQARIPAAFPEKDNSQLMKSSLASGLFRPFTNGSFHPGGIDIDRNFHPINRENKVENCLWAVGTPVEGPKYYTYIVPRNGVNSTGLVDAGKVILDLFEQILQRNEDQKIHRLFSRSPTDVRLLLIAVLVCSFIGLIMNHYGIKNTETFSMPQPKFF